MTSLQRLALVKLLYDNLGESVFEKSVLGFFGKRDEIKKLIVKYVFNVDINNAKVNVFVYGEEDNQNSNKKENTSYRLVNIHKLDIEDLSDIVVYESEDEDFLEYCNKVVVYIPVSEENLIGKIEEYAKKSSLIIIGGVLDDKIIEEIKNKILTEYLSVKIKYLHNENNSWISYKIQLYEIKEEFLDKEIKFDACSFKEYIYNTTEKSYNYRDTFKTLRGHTDSIYSVSFSHDEKYLASASGDKTIKIWSVDNWKEITTLKGHEHKVYSVSFSPDGKYLASGDEAGNIKIWSVNNWQEITTLVGHTDSVLSVSFDPSGKFLASAGRDMTIKIWSIGEKKEDWGKFNTTFGHKASIYSISIKGKYLASASGDATIKIWSVTDWKEIKTLYGHETVIHSISFSPDGRYLASASSDKTIKIWSVDEWEEIITLEGHSLSVNSVLFSSDGKHLISASEDKTIKIWSTSNWKEIITLEGHIDSIYSISLSSYRKYLVSAGKDKTIKVWHVNYFKENITLRGHNSFVNAVSFSPDGRYLASASRGYITINNDLTIEDNTIKIWSVNDWKEIITLEGKAEYASSISFSPKGKYFVSPCKDYTIKIWSVKDWKEVATLIGHTTSVYAISFSPDEKYLVSADSSEYIKVWLVGEWKEIITLRGHYSVYSISFSPDGKYLAVAGKGKIKIWSVDKWRVINNPLEGYEGHNIYSVSFSPDGKYLAGSVGKGKIRIWIADDWNEFIDILHSYTIYSISFSPDGKYLATASSDKTIKIWTLDTDDEYEISTLEGHNNSVRAVCFSPDGKYLASASDDKTVKIWFTDPSYYEGSLLKILKDLKNIVLLSYLREIEIENIQNKKSIVFFGKSKGGKTTIINKLFGLNLDTWSLIAIPTIITYKQEKRNYLIDEFYELEEELSIQNKEYARKYLYRITTLDKPDELKDYIIIETSGYSANNPNYKSIEDILKLADKLVYVIDAETYSNLDDELEILSTQKDLDCLVIINKIDKRKDDFDKIADDIKRRLKDKGISAEIKFFSSDDRLIENYISTIRESLKKIENNKFAQYFKKIYTEYSEFF